MTLTDLLDVLGLMAVLVAAYATDWRLGLALTGVLVLFVSFTLARAADAEAQEDELR